MRFGFTQPPATWDELLIMLEALYFQDWEGNQDLNYPVCVELGCGKGQYLYTAIAASLIQTHGRSQVRARLVGARNSRGGVLACPTRSSCSVGAAAQSNQHNGPAPCKLPRPALRRVGRSPRPPACCLRYYPAVLTGLVSYRAVCIRTAAGAVL